MHVTNTAPHGENKREGREEGWFKGRSEGYREMSEW